MHSPPNPRCRIKLLGVVALGLCVNLSALSQRVAEAPACDQTFAEAAIRDLLASQVIAPIYPDEAIKAGITGVAVAEICVAPGAESASVKLVASPNDAIGRSVTHALSQWRFRRLSDRYSYGGKIVYYFTEQAGRWAVLSSNVFFYVGPLFARGQRVNR